MLDFSLRRRELLLGMGGISLAQLVGCASPQPPPATPKNASNPPPPNAPAVPPGLVLGYFAQFGVDEQLFRTGLASALSKGADRADLYFEHKVSTYLVLEDGEVNRAYTSVDLGVGVRAVKGDQTGYGYTEELTADAIKKAGETAASVAADAPTNGPTSFHIGKLPQRYVTKTSWDIVRAEQRLPILARIDKESRATDKRITKVKASMTDEHGAILVVDSEGRVFEDVIPNTMLYVNVTADDGKGRRETNGHNIAARAGFEFYSDDRVGRLIKEASSSTLVLFDSTPAPLGEMTVVLAPGASGILLHEAIGHGMEADFNRKNASIYADRINSAIAKPIVSIVDDGTIDFQRGAINIDDEGNAPEKTLLVDKGTLATYLHDSISAKHYGVKPTGSGRRESFRYQPMPRMRATYMLPGPHTEAEIVKSVKKGIYCSKFTNGQVNIGAGDFTFYVKNGFLIEDGKLTKPVTDVNLIGNGPKVLEQVDMVADKLEFDEGGWTCGKNGQSVPVSLGMPAVRVANMTVGGRKA